MIALKESNVNNLSLHPVLNINLPELNNIRSTYNTNTVTKLAEGLIKFHSRTKAAKYAGIAYQTFLRWMEEHEEFRKVCEQCEQIIEEKRKEFAQKCIIKAMPKFWASGAWWLERNYPEKYALKYNHGSEAKFLINFVSKDEVKQVEIKVEQPTEHSNVVQE